MSIQSNFPNLKPSLLLDFANTKQLDNRVTFTRSTSAVYYDGKTTAMAEQNLFPYSQDFDNGVWIKGQSSVTANSTTAPDGTTTADTLTDNSTAGTYHYIYQTASFVYGATYVLSCYAKNNNGQYIGLSAQNDLSSYAGATFDVVNGTFNTGQGGTGWFASASMTSVGNGWYRCVVVITSGINATVAVQIYRSNSSSAPGGYGMYAYTGSGQSVYIWGAQLEQRSSATAYTATTTQPITNYIPVLLTAGGNQPRFDCNPTTGESLGLLIEEQRTNVFFSSESNTSWSTDGTGSVLLDSATINPAGQAGGWIYKNAGYAYLNWGSGVSAGTWTYSVYIKKSLFNTTNVGRVSMFTPSVAVDYNFGTGVITLQSGSPVSYGCQRLSDTMARVWITVTITGATLGIGAFDNSINSTLLWGLQIESGSFPTSYIKTVSAATTRTADAASMTGANFSSWYAQGFGTLYAEYGTLQDTGASTVACPIEINDGTQNKFFQSGPYTYAGNTANIFTRNASSLGANSTSALISRNGSTLGPYTDSAVSVSGLTQFVLGIGRIYYSSPARIKKVAYYPIVATQAQLNALTS